MNRFSRVVLLSLLGALLVGGFSRAAQTDLSSHIPELGRERACLERRSLFLNAWVEADSEARARARRVLRLERDGADRISATPSVRALTKAWDALLRTGAESLKPSLARELALSLDLRVVPGFYTGSPAGEHEPLTVRVAPLYSVALDVPVFLSLIWIGQDGVEIRARREPIGPMAFREDGFLMYVRAPSAIPGVWNLTCQVELEETTARGVSVPVVGLDTPKALVEGADLATQAQFNLLGEQGIRPTFFHAFLETVGVLPISEEERWLGARLNWFKGGALGSLASAGHRVWSVGTQSVSSPETLVLLLRPEDESPEAALVGSVGEAWETSAKENAWWVFSTDLRLRADEGASLLSLAAQMREWKPDAQLVLVGRGTALLELQLALLHESKWPFDQVVVSTVLSPNVKPKKLPKARGLIVTSEAPERGAEALELPGGWEWEKRTDPLVVTDLALPGLVAGWLGKK